MAKKISCSIGSRRLEPGIIADHVPWFVLGALYKWFILCSHYCFKNMMTFYMGRSQGPERWLSGLPKDGQQLSGRSGAEVQLGSRTNAVLWVCFLTEIVPHGVSWLTLYLWQFSILCLPSAGPQVQLVSECIFFIYCSSVMKLEFQMEIWVRIRKHEIRKKKEYYQKNN